MKRELTSEPRKGAEKVEREPGAGENSARDCAFLLPRSGGPGGKTVADPERSARVRGQETHPGGEGLPSQEPSAKQSNGDTSQMLWEVQWV